MREPTLKPMPKPPVEEDGFDATDPVAVRRREDRAKLHEASQRDAWAFVVGDPRGRKVLFDILAKGGLYKDGFHNNALFMSNFAGRRALALEVLSEITAADPEAYITMQQEALKEAANG